MNRSERRRLEKKMRINEYVKKLSREEKFERIRQNIIEGNKKQSNMSETVRIQDNNKKDQVDNSKIASLATSLMISEDLDYIDALEKAKETLNKTA